MATYTPYTPNYNRMQAAVSAAQKQRATVAGPPSPMMTSGVDVSQGVEQQARAIGGAPADILPPVPAQMTAAPMMTAAPAQAQAPVNPLGGMDARSLSARGGPMGYSQQGVGTNNPNSYAVGQKRAPLGMRLLERQARRRDPRAIGQLASMEQQNTQNAAQMSMAQMREAGDAQRFGQQQQQQMTMFQQQQAGMQQRDATGFDQQKQILAMQGEQRANESAQEFQRRQTAEAAQRAGDSIVGDATIPMQGGTVPAVRTQSGMVRMAGSFMPERKPDAPIPAGLVPQGAVRDGVRYGPPPAPKPMSFRPIPGAPSMIQGGTPTPDRVFDPYTGVFYEAGQVPGRGTPQAPTRAAATPAAGAQTAAASPPAASTQTKGGNSYSFK